MILVRRLEWSRLTGLDAGGSSRLSSAARSFALLFAWLDVTPSAAAPDQTRTTMLLGLGLLYWLLVYFVLKGYPGNRARWDSGFRIGAMGMLALLPSLAGVVYLKYLLPAGYLVLALVVLVER